MGLAVLNRDDSSYGYLAEVVQPSIPNPHSTIRSISYGLNPAADTRAESIKYSPGGIQFDAIGPGFYVPVTSPLEGAFNVSNCWLR